MTIRNPWRDGFETPDLGALSPEERALLKDAEEIASQVARMSNEEVADYIVDNNLQDLVAPERLDAIMAKAVERARKRAADTSRAEGGKILAKDLGRPAQVGPGASKA